jgi:hypothetical protein
MTHQLRLVPDQSKKSKPLFMNEEAYQKFRASFYEQVKPELDRNREARRLSEEAARRHLVY